MLKQPELKNTSDIHILKRKLIDLSNQLLKTFKISTIAFTVIKIVETMQMVYFLIRVKHQENLWNYPIIKYFSIILNLISLDNLFNQNPDFFSYVLLAALSSFLAVFLLCIIVAWNSGWGKKVTFVVKLSTPAIYIFLYLLKTLLVIPITILISLSIFPQASQSYNLNLTSDMAYSHGSLLFVLFFIGMCYILYMFREENPFSELPYAGQSILKGLLWVLFKIGMSVTVVLDKNKSHLFLETLLFTIVFLFFIIEGHWQTGLYKIYSQKLQMLLLYLSFVLGLLQCFDMQTQQKTTLTYLIPFLVIAYITYQWIVSKQIKSILSLNLQQNNDYKLLEKQVICLINLIDGINLRQNTLVLQGYLHIHRRQCRKGVNCPCQRLVILKQRVKPEVKLQFFRLVVSLLLDGNRKFVHEKKIDLLLCLIYHYRTKNYLQAIYSIYKMLHKDEQSLQDRFYFSFYLQHIQREMAQLDQKETSHSADVNKFMDYTNKMVDLENNIESCTRHHIEFWRLVMDNDPEIKRLEDLGTLITRTKEQLREQFEIIYEANSNSIHLLTIYAKFQLEVTNQESYNVKYLEKAEAIYKNIKQSKKIDDRSSKYNQNANTGVIIISGDQGQLGNIVHTNNLTKGMLGYKRSDLLQKNVSTIMPKIYADSHHAVLTRYIAASQSKVNGMERIVPALNKQGFMLPVTALTKPLPSLTKGIEIIAFLAKYEQKSADDEEVNRKINYILYRSDTQQIMGICQGCYKDYGINPALTYGNPNNLNNQLKIKHLFGLSFQKSEEGKIAAALEVGEVSITLNTKQLKDIFIVNKGAISQKLIQSQDQIAREGVQIEVPIKITISSVYHGVPLKLLAIYGKKSQQDRKSQPRNNRASKNENKTKKYHDTRKKQQSIVQQLNKTETDDMKNLKDFKNFISIKREPSAITAISTICMFFMIVIAGVIIVLIVYWLQLLTLNSNALSLYKLTLQTQISTPELMSQVQKQLISYNNITGFTTLSSINDTTNQIVSQLKGWQLQILPYKFYFNSAYNQQTTKYSLLSTGNLQTQQILQQGLINEYLSQIQSIISSNISSLTQSNISNNIYQKYISSKLNQIFSIRPQYNSSNIQIGNWYSSFSNQHKIVVIALNMVMIGSVILWLILLLPYVLSVTKINNRVLSLFTLIPSFQVSRLIYNSLRFLGQNLTEAVVNPDDLKLYQKNIDSSDIKQIYIESNLGSPSQFNLNYSITQGELRRPSQLNKQKRQSVIGVEQRFQKMGNSEDRNKKITILKFMGISALILAFILFYMLYSLNYISSLQTSINNYYLVGRRPALIRNIKFLLIEYLLNPTYLFSSKFSSIRTLNINLISQFYTLQANLLKLSLGSSQSMFNLYNGGDVCGQTTTFSSYSIFNQTFATSQCYLFNSGVLQKGLTTGVVSVLEDIRSILSQYTTSVPQNVLVAKILQYDLVLKYIETPMLAVAASVQDSVNSTIKTTKFVMVLAGILFIIIILSCWRLVWSRYLSELNVKIWRTKGLLNLIPMRIITSNDLLKNEFTSGQLQKAVR